MTFFAILGGIALLLFVYCLGGMGTAKTMKNWVTLLGTAETLPENPPSSGRYWLRSVHRGMKVAEEKIEGLEGNLARAQEQQERSDFLYNCVMASTLEGVLVVDRGGRIVLVNSEFMNVFQLTQSPVSADFRKIVPESKVIELVETTIKTGQVQTDVIRRKYSAESGRPLTYEVRTVPIFLGNREVYSVIVLFLPPADRPRMVQTLKWHAQKLHYLVNELQVSSQTRHRLPETHLEDVEPKLLLQEVRDRFLTKPDHAGVDLTLNIEASLPVFRADRTELQAALLQLLENTLFYAEEGPKIVLSAIVEDGCVRLLIEVQGADFPAQEVALLGAAETAGVPSVEDAPLILGGSSGLLSIRESLQAQEGRLEIESGRKNQIAFAVSFPSRKA